MHVYEDQFSEAHDLSGPAVPSKVLIIASTGRSGSHMLGHALHRTNKFGFPLEYANPRNLAEWKRRLGRKDLPSVMAELQRRRTSPNGVFGIKIHYPHVAQFGGFGKLVAFFPEAYYVLLSRKDVLRQAVSLSIAKQTGVWIAGQEPVGNDPVYDFAHIETCLRETIANLSAWRYALAASGCRYMEMDFDEVRHSPVASIQRIASFSDVAIDSDAIPSEPVTSKKSDQRKVQWTTRFNAEFNARARQGKCTGGRLTDRMRKQLMR